MSIPIIMKKMGQQMESGTINKWLVAEGEYVNKGDPILELETDKATLEVESPATGFIQRENVNVEEEIIVGQTIATIVERKEDIANEVTDNSGNQKKQETTKVNSTVNSNEFREPVKSLSTSIKNINTDRRIKASPFARKLARENDVSLEIIEGSKENGRIIAQDIQNYLKENSNKEFQVLPLDSMRKSIIKTIKNSALTVIPVTITVSVNMEKAMFLRDEIKNEGQKISPNDLIICAVSRALTKHKIFNSFIDDEIKISNSINIGFAVAKEKGLFVPVIANCDRKHLLQIAKERREQINQVNEGKYSPVTNGTFTISSLGEYGVESFTPIIYPNQAAILGVGRINKRATEENGQIKFYDSLKLSLVFDHRITDGVPAAKFLNEIKSMLEQPIKMLL